MAQKNSPINVLIVIFRVLFTGFALYTMFFIFSNSLEIAAVSAERSGRITAMINAFLNQMGIPDLTEHAVRKLAHFCEYALLGFWYMLCLRVYTSHYIKHISWPLLLILLMANMDETLQTFVDGRSGQVTDVWIDFAGGVAGVCCGWVLLALLNAFFRLLGFGRKKKTKQSV